MPKFVTMLYQNASTEFKALWNNKRNLVVLVGSPLLFMTLLGFLYSQHVVTGIKTVVFDQDQSSLSRLVRDNLANSDKFALVGEVESEEELRQVIEHGVADAALVIPADFSRNIKKQQGSEVLIVVNGSNMLISNSVVGAASEIIQTLSAGIGIKVMTGKGLLPVTARTLASELSMRTRVWYNPTYNYANFMLLGLLGTVIQQVMLLFTAIAVIDGKNDIKLPFKDNSFPALSAYVLGKYTPYFLISWINTNLVLVLTCWGFQVPFRGSWLTLFILEAVFISCVASLGIFLSTICHDQLQATQVAMLIAVPSFMLSGYTWPLQSMPAALQLIAQALPLTYFANALRKLALMGVSWPVIGKDIFILGIAASVFVPLSILTLLYKTKHPTRTTPSPELQQSSI